MTLKYRLIALTTLVFACGLNPANSEFVTLPTHSIEVLEAVGYFRSVAEIAANQHAKPTDAENQVADQVKGHAFLSEHNARMTVLPDNSVAHFKLSLDGLSEADCKVFIAFATRDPVAFSGVEVNGELMKGYSAAACGRNVTVSLLRM